MVHFKRENIIIIFLDLLLSLFSFWFIRYFSDLPRWYWLVLSAFIWLIIGILSGKLRYGDYKRVRYALLGIITINILSGFLLNYFYGEFVPGYEYDNSILWASGLISVCEITLYYFIRKIYYRKIPYFYEEPILHEATEKGSLSHPLEMRTEFWNPDISLFINKLQKAKRLKDVFEGFVKSTFSDKTILLDSTNPESVLRNKTQLPNFIVMIHTLVDVRYLNTLLSYANYCLTDGGYIACHYTTMKQRRRKILRQIPIGINYILIIIDYIWNRIIARSNLTKKLYYKITRGKNRSLHKVELLGRIYRAGFEVVQEGTCGGENYVIASKKIEPVRTDNPNTGILIRLKRIGKNGKPIGVYKLRTMYAYSEYLQPYIYKQEGLCKGGKIAYDYRITPLGKFLRRTWIDELPMLINWLKGEMKFVGIRPLSNQYFGLYSKELQELRIMTKPGLFPPFYADMPETLEEIQTSEMHYLKSYFKSPFLTDWRYFCAAFCNIVFKRKRSK